jgi:hypothetical protein
MRRYEVRLTRWVEQECLLEIEAANEEDYERALYEAKQSRQNVWEETGDVREVVNA